MKRYPVRQFLWLKLKAYLRRILRRELTVIDMAVTLLLLCLTYWLVCLVQWTLVIVATVTISYLIYRILMWFD